jgi:hypothetical protein
MKIETIDYSEIAFADMHVVRKRIRWVDGQDHSRWVLKGPSRSSRAPGARLYYKVWNPSYVRRDNILDGLHSGFYDRTVAPALVALIFEGDVCRGYVMEECTKYGKIPRAFYELIKEKTVQTGHFLYDLTGCNIMRFSDRFSLIDLESIYPLREATNLGAHHCRFACKAYETFVMSISTRHGQLAASRPDGLS